MPAQRFLNVRIMLPAKPQSVFPFHTGLLYGHGQGSRSLWLPLTDISSPEDSSASLQVIGLQRSRELILEAHERSLGIQEMSDLFSADSSPVPGAPGRVLLFTQENIHGNFINETGKTRVSIDFRLAEARFADRLARKIPGGYFEILSDTPRPALEDAPHAGEAHLIYLNNNTPSTESVPPHLQRSLIHDFCRRHGVSFEFELFELEHMDHLPTLDHIVENLRRHVLLYSVYSLPEDPEQRSRILRRAIEQGLTLRFANEGLALYNEETRLQVEELLAFARYGLPPTV